MIDANQAFREFQQVMPPSSDSSDVPKDVNAEAQNPQMLLATDNGFALLPIDLTRHEELSGLGSLKKALDSAKVKATELGLSQVATDVETWVEMHPWKAAFYTASALGFVAPELLSIPAMEALGFGVAGVHAGKTPLHTEMLYGSVSNWETQNRRIRGRQDSVRDWPDCRSKRFRYLAKCTHGRLRSCKCQWWCESSDRVDGRCDGEV